MSYNMFLPQFYLAIAALLAVIDASSINMAVHKDYNDYKAVNNDHKNYMAVIDAGSSHTTVLLYQWETSEPPKEVTQCVTMDGGIDQFAEQPLGLWMYLEPCIQQVAMFVPATELSLCPIFLGATAGMRLLQRENPLAAREVMAVVEQVLQESGFLYQEGHARILTGREEGGYSWIAVNSLKGSFGDGFGETVGALDMGGASAQVAFQCQVDDPFLECDSASEDILEFDIYGRKYLVFSASNQCYGLKEAMHRFVVLIILENFEKNGGILTETLENPCLRANVSTKDDWLTEFPSKKSEIFNSRCTDLNQLVDAEFTNALANLDDEFIFQHVDGWNIEQCRNIIDNLIDDDCALVFDDSCFDLKTSVPSGGFLAMSSYFWEFGKLLNISQASMDEAAAKIEDLCNQNTEDVFGRETNCFEVMFIFEMITDGYRFDEETFGNLEFVEKVEGQEVAWPLGFVVNKA